MSAASARAWKAANPDRVRETHREWYARQSPEWRAARYAETRKWAAANRDTVRQIQRKYLGIPEPTRPKPERCECRGCLPGKRGLQIDHDHETGEFRGWICFRCNTAIGKLGDTIAGLKEALAYLENSCGQPTVYE